MIVAVLSHKIPKQRLKEAHGSAKVNTGGLTKRCARGSGRNDRVNHSPSPSSEAAAEAAFLPELPAFFSASLSLTAASISA